MDEVQTPQRGVKRPLETPSKDLADKRSRQMSIVLTGGPCSGKSSVLAVIRDRLSKRGMQVVTVPEYATHFFANSDGFQGEWVGTEKEEGLQCVFLKYQMMQEDMFKTFAALNSKPTVLLLDRGVMDQKVFTSSLSIWNEALKQCNVTEDDILKRYDMVMHLSTCAKVGEYEWGPGSNNPGRYHTPEEAATLDKTCEDVYKGHKQLRMVPHCPKFEDKLEFVMKYLEDALGVDGLAGKRERAEVKVIGTIPEDVLLHSQAWEVQSAFLDTTMQRSVRRRLRIPIESWSEGLKGAHVAVPKPTRSCHGDIDQTFEERRSIPDEHFLARRVIQETEYNTAIQIAPYADVDKHVLSFQLNGQHYELFYFQDGGERKLLLDSTVGAELPHWLEPTAKGHIHPSGIKSARMLKRNSTAEAADSHRLLRAQSGA